MEAVFGKFGPLVFHTRINKDLCKKILKLCNKKNPANHKLVGHMKHQHDIDNGTIFTHFHMKKTLE